MRCQGEWQRVSEKVMYEARFALAEAKANLLNDLEGVVVVFSQSRSTHECEDGHNPFKNLATPKLAHSRKQLIYRIVQSWVRAP